MAGFGTAFMAAAAVALGVGLPEAIALGAAPFLVGDGLKILLAAGLLPLAWRLAGGDRR